LTTDGIIDVFSTYHTTTPLRNARSASYVGGWLDGNGAETNQRFGVGVGLLPSVVAFNIKAPTTNGVDSTVRIGLYPSIQNADETRFSTGSHLDVREVFYTAKGRYGEILAGRALNLYQGKNILTDMTLLTAGTVGPRWSTVTLGHIGYGYLYANFGPQMRYTTPEFWDGAKFAIAIAEPYNISGRTDMDKTNIPRIEAELSYAKTFKSGTTVQAWLSGLYQRATSREYDTNPQSIGGAYGIGAGFNGIDLLLSGYGGRGLGMLSAQDGALGSGSVDWTGKERKFYGFLAQATYQINPTWKLGVNYGQNRLIETDHDKSMRAARALAKRQESGVASITYNMNSFTQFVFEYIHARDTFTDGAQMRSNQFAFGTMFYW